MLPVPYVMQSANNWCWAACGEMLFRHRGQPSLTQCALAAAQFHQTCCISPTPSACDLGCWPDEAYPAHGMTVTPVYSAMTVAQVQGQLAAGRPVQVCYKWTGGDQTHVALIIGEHPNGDFEVLDPYRDYGRAARRFSQITGAYGLGTWIRSFTF
ncbi:MAG TPA: papain-like cysteine protease family protein [Sphingomicrobium sp.]|nr:papain-like cysteine protease family protein [Sphingomicrobium sp.]